MHVVGSGIQFGLTPVSVHRGHSDVLELIFIPGNVSMQVEQVSIWTEDISQIKHTAFSEQWIWQQLFIGEDLGVHNPMELLRKMQQLLGDVWDTILLILGSCFFRGCLTMCKWFLPPPLMPPHWTSWQRWRTISEVVALSVTFPTQLHTSKVSGLSTSQSSSTGHQTLLV